MSEITEFPIPTYGSSKTGAQVEDAVTDVQNAKAASATDTTAGRLLKVGDFGVGDGIELTNADDLNTILQPGIYRCTTVPVNAPLYPAGDGVFRTSTVEIIGGNGIRLLQRYTFVRSLEPGQNRTFQRTTSDGGAVWTSWAELLHTGNLLGPVSQSGGVPTGAVIERGSNANGEFVKFADGTLICKKGDFQLAFANGSRYTSSWTLPASFINDQYVGFWEFADPAEIEPRSTARYSGPKIFRKIAGSLAEARLYRNANLTSFTDEGDFTCSICAIGRWF